MIYKLYISNKDDDDDNEDEDEDENEDENEDEEDSALNIVQCVFISRNFYFYHFFKKNKLKKHRFWKISFLYMYHLC